MIDLKLASLMSSKLCHDVIGPIGAVCNGIELASDDSNADMRTEALKLVSSSAGDASARLQFYRLAFGLAGGMGQDVSIRDARSLSRDLMSYGKVALDWPDTAGGAELLPKDVIKIICNLVVISAATLPRGGTLAVSGDVKDGAWSFTFHARGPRAVLREDVTAILQNGYDEEGLTAQNVGVQYLMALCANNGATLHIREVEDESVVLSVQSA
ncbi:histidine phosphotransferase family protein [Sneathiella sp.]|jgi:histidine phosphotransferase ChpT|uniref:histidine phosphotransferase family protein n=1 Tax=Sneathiella sp. TaxID=1964365 RepID=UPI0025F2F8D1|nr:histidine phosphotransferase family protein [Sneathiella sp.]|tara:strand:+ start:239 stop:877 length:639 start_codon:yes stop_codon:yes gene_type:complete